MTAVRGAWCAIQQSQHTETFKKLYRGETRAVLVTMEYLGTGIEVFRKDHNDRWLLSHNQDTKLKYEVRLRIARID